MNARIQRFVNSATQDFIPCLECEPAKFFLYLNANHLRTHDLTRQDYVARHPDAPLSSPALKAQRSATSKQNLAKPKVRQRMSASQRRYWEDRPEARKERGEKTKLALAKPKVRQRMSASQRLRWGSPEVRKQHGKLMKKVMANPEIRQRISVRMKIGWSKPGVRERMSAGQRKYWDNPTVRKEKSEKTKLALANPKVRQRMSAAQRRHWDKNPARRLIIGNRSKQIWAERKKKLAEAERILAESRSSVLQVQKPAAFRLGGRPRKDIERRRVLQLKSQGKSWAQVQIIMNKETGQDKTANAYRNLVLRDHRPSEPREVKSRRS
jgi:hypothetical protein